MWRGLFWCWIAVGLGAGGCAGPSEPKTPSAPKNVLEGRLPKGAKFGKPEGHSAQINCLSFSPDGERLVSGAEDGSVLVWDVDSGRVLKRFEEHAGRVGACAFFPDGERIVSAELRGRVAVWSIQSRRVQWLKGLHPVHNVFSLSAHPNGGEVLAGGAYGVVMRWQLERPETPVFDKQELRGATPQDLVRAVGYLKNQPFGAGAAGFRMWSSTKPYAPMRTIKLDSASASSLPEGRLALGADGEIRLYWPASEDLGEQQLRDEREGTGHQGRVLALAADSIGSRLLSADDEGTVRLWEIGQVPYRIRCSLQEQASLVATAFDARHERVAVAGNSPSIVVASASDCRQLMRLGIPRSRLSALTTQLDAVLLGDSSGSVHRWSLPNLEEQSRECVHRGRVTALSAGPKGAWFSIGADLNIFQGPKPKLIGKTQAWADVLALQPDGRALLVGDSRGHLQRLSLSGGETKFLPRLSGSIRTIAMHPNGQNALLGGDFFTLARLGLPSGEELSHGWNKLLDLGENTKALAFDTQGELFAQGGIYGTVLLRDAGDGRKLAKLGGLSAEINGFAIHGSSLWAGDANGILARWNLRRIQTGSPNLTIDEGAPIVRIQSTPDNQYLMALLNDGRVSVRKLPDGELVAHLYSFTDGSWATIFAETADQGSRFISKYPPRPSAINAALGLYAEVPDKRQEYTLAGRLEPNNNIPPFHFGKEVITHRDSQGIASARATLFSPSGPPTVSLNGMWKLAIQPLSLPSAYEIHVIFNEPKARSYSLHAEAPDRKPIDISFNLPPDLRAGRENKKALFIGNEDYIHLNDAPGSIHDSERFADLLQNEQGWKLGDGKTVNKNRKGNELRADLQAFFRNAAAEDTLLLYYAGHGLNLQGEGFLLGTDARDQNAMDGRVSITEIQEYVKKSPARHIAVVIDACRDSKLLLSGIKPSIAESSEKSVVFVFSTALSKNAPGPQQGGAFSTALLDAFGLNDLDLIDRSMGAVTLERAFGHALRKSDQSPILAGRLAQLPLYFPAIQREETSPSDLSLSEIETDREDTVSIQEAKLVFSRNHWVFDPSLEAPRDGGTLQLNIRTHLDRVQRFYVQLTPVDGADNAPLNAIIETEPKTGTMELRIHKINRLEPDTAYQGYIQPCEGKDESCILRTGAKFRFKTPHELNLGN